MDESSTGSLANGTDTNVVIDGLWAGNCLNVTDTIQALIDDRHITEIGLVYNFQFCEIVEEYEDSNIFKGALGLAPIQDSDSNEQLKNQSYIYQLAQQNDIEPRLTF